MIRIKYDGRFPNLCRGHLKVWDDDKYYDFGKYCLCSGGNVWFDDNWSEHVEEGPWNLMDEYIPKDFPKEKTSELLNIINSEIPHGCCGGCV